LSQHILDVLQPTIRATGRTIMSVKNDFMTVASFMFDRSTSPNPR
jgi:hypothetical protein